MGKCTIYLDKFLDPSALSMRKVDNREKKKEKKTRLISIVSNPISIVVVFVKKS